MEATTPQNIEPAIDLSRSTDYTSLCLNVEAEASIMEHRERMARRRSAGRLDMAEVRVREMWNWTPGVGWDTGIPGRYDGPMPDKPKEPVRWHGDAPGDEGFDDVHGVYHAVFIDVRTREHTIVTDQGEVTQGNALEDAPYRDFGGLARLTFGPLTPR